jgi:hypothetical protein
LLTPPPEPIMIIKRVYAAIGLIIGAILSMVALAGGMAANSSGGAGMGAMLGAGAIIAAPIFYGCIGFIGTLVFAALYNVVANVIGGIQVDVE